MSINRMVWTAVALLLAALFVAVVQVSGDVMIREREATMPTKVADTEIAGFEDTITIWLTREKARKDAGDRSFLYDAKAGLVYTLFHKSKLYTIHTQNGMNVTDSSKDPHGTIIEGLAEMRKPPALQVTETDSTILLNGFLCRKYLLVQDLDVPTTTGKTCADLWATEQIVLDIGLYRAIKSANTRGLEYGGATDSSVEGICGFPVLLLSVSTGTSDDFGTMTVTASEELLEFREVEAPAGYFEVPKDYKPYSPPQSGK
jgi:hypothetical protein